jgi:hypothetical protein
LRIDSAKAAERAVETTRLIMILLLAAFYASQAGEAIQLYLHSPILLFLSSSLKEHVCMDT